MRQVIRKEYMQSLSLLRLTCAGVVCRRMPLKKTAKGKDDVGVTDILIEVLDVLG